MSDFEVPLGLTGRDIDDSARGRAFHRMRSDVSDISYGVEPIVDVAWELTRREDFFDLVVEVFLRCAEMVLQNRLQAPPAVCGAGLGAICENREGFEEVLL